MEDAYRKQCRFALLSFLVVLFLTHLAPVFYFIPQLTALYILGFPAHYFITLVVGWIGTMVFYWFYIQISEKIDQEIDETSGAAFAAEQGKEPAGAAKATGGAR